MLILPDRKIVLLATPRTGSRAIKEAVKEGAKARGEPYTETKLHHPFPHEVPKYKYERWSIIREPINQLKSWMSHAKRWDDPIQFIKKYKTRYFFYEGGMNIYANVTDRFFIYEDGAHKSIMTRLGLDPDLLEVVGKTDSAARNLSNYEEALAEYRFRKDFELYFNALMYNGERKDRWPI